jgi:putative PIN family toxin of toxin-antitoxin system
VKIVLDTNILLPSISRKSPLNWIFVSLLNEEYTLCVTTEILLEYTEVIERFFGSEVADNILEAIRNLPNLELVTAYYKWNLITEDPDDNKFVDCAIATNAKYIVSHDRHFNVLETIDFPNVEVISAIDFQKTLNEK